MESSTEKKRGIRYYLTDEQIRRYREKPLELRLAWLYQGNVLRMHLPREIRERQDRFRR
jgi:hypothetical protein